MEIVYGKIGDLPKELIEKNNGCVCGISQQAMNPDTLKFIPGTKVYFHCPVHSSESKQDQEQLCSTRDPSS